MTLAEAARAKVNLALHVVGRRADGYHLLDSLVAFPPLGDRLAATAAEGLSLAVTGPGAEDLSGTAAGDNLVMRAARGLAAIAATASGREPGAAITLEKHLPVSAGLGGGSADAAAAIRLLCRLWNLDPASPDVATLAGSLGADVPMCLASRPLRATGIGETLTPVGPLPDLAILLVNPRTAVATPDVFRALEHRTNPPLPGTIPVGGREDFLSFLRAARNDLEPAAIAVAPVVGLVLDRLRAAPGQRLARMSGSGATCFALFEHMEEAAGAAAEIQAERPDWWVRHAALDDGRAD